MFNLFDPFASRLLTVPDDIREVLQSRYEFVITEKEVVADLTDSVHQCDSCALWCPTCVLFDLRLDPLNPDM